MRNLRVLALVPAVLLLQGCWFVFIPPGVMNAVSDSVTGAQGDNCVASSVKVGELVRSPTDGSYWRVQSLSGTSNRCTDPALPIRAKLAPT
jgi:hypothetical protein